MRLFSSTPSVHPRVRGEQAATKPAMSAARRFIPACAGNRPRGPGGVDGVPVHPRVRGEQARAGASALLRIGSSPRARGTVPMSRKAATRRRFIPACAGNSRPQEGQALHPPVHPRVRGEQAVPWSVSNAQAGSSPRARGTGVSGNYTFQEIRFIPACAGNSACGGIISDPTTVHPRVRGEQRVTRPMAPGYPGSSPRARGTVFQYILDSNRNSLHGNSYRFESPKHSCC